MSEDAAAPTLRRMPSFSFGGAWPLAAAFLALAGPTVYTLAQDAWGLDTAAHGPIVMLTGAWLIWRAWPSFKAEGAPGDWRLTALALIVALPVYVFGRAYDFILLEAMSLYAVGVAVLQSMFGLRVLLRNWFPFFYLAFAIPLPGWILDTITAPLKELISSVVTNGLYAVGIPIAREGVTLFVAQYQLLVEDACSGMNSLIGLSAIGLFYIHLMHKASWRYSLLLAAFIVPIAIVANILRVAALVLLTYYFGDEVGQGFMHEGTGVFLFATALILIFALDGLLRSVWGRGRKGAAA